MSSEMNAATRLSENNETCAQIARQGITETEAKHQFQREIGAYGGQTAGPLVIGIGGIHGNEPAGVLALRRVLQRLRAAAPPFKGRLVAFAGNVGALNSRRRYQWRDLNRMWTAEYLNLIGRMVSGRALEPEESEQRELITAIRAALERSCGEVVFLDLHTTSSDGAPFSVISDTLINRRWAGQFGVPIILGLEESIDGTILNYINDLGYAAIGFEAGQHEAPSTVEHHEAVIWLALVEAGCLDPEDAPDPAALRSTLKSASSGLPRAFELRYRHRIREADNFVMEPGYLNFQPVEKGQVLARDRCGEIQARERGYLFMPLYQQQGEDGFFLVREVKPFWLKVSEWMRRCGLDRLLPWMPGVRCLTDRPGELAIDLRIARWFVVEICHLLGFRKEAQDQKTLIVSRRRQSP